MNAEARFRPSRARRRLAVLATIAALAALALITAAFALAEKPVTVRSGNLILTVNGALTPKALSETTMEPVALNLEGKIATADGTHPPQLYALDVHMEKNVSIDARGVPTCQRVPLQEQTTTEGARQLCKAAIVGTGTIEVELASPGQTPTPVQAQLIAFNGGISRSATPRKILFIYAFLPSPMGAAIVATVNISKEHKGPYPDGTRLTAAIPPIADGYGSVTAFRLTFPKKLFAYKGVKHGYLLARCADGHFHAQAEAHFSTRSPKAGFTDETKIGPAKITRACTQKK